MRDGRGDAPRRRLEAERGGPGQRAGELAHRRETVGRELGECLVQRSFHRLGDVGAHGSHGTRRIAEYACDHRLYAASRVWRIAGEHLVEHAGEREDIAASVDDVLGRDLLGAHVLGRPDEKPGLRDAGSPRSGHRERDAEVGDERVPIVEQDVLRLEVPVDDPVPVGIVERAGHFHRDRDRLADGQLALAPEPRAQRLAGHVRHDVEEEPRGVSLGRELRAHLAGIEQGKQVRVLKARHHLDFGQKPVDPEHRPELMVQELECNGPMVLAILRQKHGGHASASDLALDVVSIREGDAESIEQGALADVVVIRLDRRLR